jgi:transitional endoplasmic reticulum ATPase
MQRTIKARKPRREQAPVRLDDPFIEPMLDYVRNLILGRALKVDQARRFDNDATLLWQALARDPGTRRTLAAAGARDAEKAVATAMRALLADRRNRPRPPSTPGEPVASNLRMLVGMLGLDDVETALLQLAVAARRHDLNETLGAIPCLGARAPAVVAAIALALPVDRVALALSPRGRLLSSGILLLREHGGLEDRLETDARLERLIFQPGLDEQTFIESFLPAAPAPTLAPPDFGHLALELSTACKLLAGALAGRCRGVNVLLYGPTGTGKSELARLLATEIRAPLLLAGREDVDGESPDARTRLASLLLGQKLLGSARSLLVFDELEDLFEDNNPFASFFRGHGGLDKRRMSKQWFNLLLENNAVPTIWISNRVSGMDPAFLRRFSYVIEVGRLTAMQRRRAWCKHLGSESVLPSHELDLLAQRFDVSPAHIGTAVATARLVSQGPVDRATLETLLKPAERLVHGRKLPPPVFHADRYLPELVNTSVDLAAVEKRVVGWLPGDGPGLSLCLYGPPGTGKSEFLRYLAHRADRPLLVKRASDIISMWVGQTEELIAAAFEEASRDDAFLLFDEADSFLQDRRGAQRTWEITEVNEFLQQLEIFPGVVACTTNLMETLDQAALRRFVFKVPFKFLRPEQAVLAFQRLLAELGGGDEVPAAVAAALRRIGNVAPGDFAAVERRMRGANRRVQADELLAEVETEVGVKEKAGGRVGF